MIFYFSLCKLNVKKFKNCYNSNNKSKNNNSLTKITSIKIIAKIKWMLSFLISIVNKIRIFFQRFYNKKLNMSKIFQY